MVRMYESTSIKRENHEPDGDWEHEETRSDGNTIIEEFVFEWEIEFESACYLGGALVKAIFHCDILVQRPYIVIVAGRLLGFHPFGLILPTSDETDTPHHNQQWIDEVTRTVISCELEKCIEPECHQSYNRSYYQPFLQKCNEFKVCWLVWTNVCF